MYGEGVGPWSSMERFSTSFELSLGVAVDILCLSCLLRSRESHVAYLAVE